MVVLALVREKWTEAEGPGSVAWGTMSACTPPRRS